MSSKTRILCYKYDKTIGYSLLKYYICTFLQRSRLKLFIEDAKQRTYQIIRNPFWVSEFISIIIY
ncbi:MAG: hypothetical protein P8J28_04620, partial [Polaribacter sp.]|nr:hypothetical protein [Polaribacter sp.]